MGESSAKIVYNIILGCFRVILLIVLIAATFIILSNHEDEGKACADTGAFMKIWTWAYVLAVVDVVYLIAIVFCITVAVTAHLQDTDEVALAAVAVMLILALVYGLFCFIWVIIGWVIIFRDNAGCRLDATALWIISLVHMIYITISIMIQCIVEAVRIASPSE